MSIEANANVNRVCVLSDGEVQALHDGEPLDCSLHKHVSEDEAFGLTASIFMQRDGQANPPVCEWVGPRHIRYFVEYEWRSVRSSLFYNEVTRRFERVQIKTKQLKAQYA